MTSRIERLLDELDGYDQEIPLDELTRLLEAMPIATADVRDHVRFSDTGYQRNLIRAGSAYQALVLCWKPGQRSKIHDHRGSACAVRVLEGTARETIYERGDDGMLVEGASTALHSGQVCGSLDGDIHEIVNPSASDELITVHIYSPPLLRAGTYSLESPEVGEWVDPNAATVGGAATR